jgi:hypothetical protein
MVLPRLSPTPSGPTDGVRTTSDPPPVEGPGGRLSPGPGGGDGGDEDDEESQDTQEDERGADDMQRTIEQLRSTGDPNEVERTPVLESGNIDVAPDEWELGFPLQGIPRLAAVLNLNYVYNEERERWERQEPFEDTAVGAPAARIADAGGQTVAASSAVVVDYGLTFYETGLTADTSTDSIQVPSNGIYQVNAAVELTNYSDRAEIGARVTAGGFVEASRTMTLTDGPSGNGTESAVITATLELDADDKVRYEIKNRSGNSLDTGGTFTAAYLEVQQI